MEIMLQYRHVKLCLDEIMKLRKHIAICVFSLAGGIGTTRVKLANGLIDRGYSVDLIYVRAEPEFLSSLQTQVRLFPLTAKSVPTMLPGLIRYLRRERPSVMLSSVDYTNVIAICARMLSRVRARLIVSFHTAIMADQDNRESLKGRLKPLIFSHFYRKADGIVAVSKGVEDELRQALRLPDSKIHLIYNPVVTPRVTKRVSHRWFGNDKFVTILAAGRLTAAKDYPTLIHAFAKFLETCDARLIILGEGPLRRRLNDLVQDLQISDRVDMIGFVENAIDYMAQSDIFVLSSAWEGLGNVLIEAMSVGTPVVSTDCKSGPREILCNGELGHLVPVGDYEALSDAMVATINNPVSASRLKRRAEFFTVERALDAYINVLFPQSVDAGQTCQRTD